MVPIVMYMRLLVCVSGCITMIIAMMYVDRLLMPCDLKTKGNVIVKALSTVMVADSHIDTCRILLYRLQESLQIISVSLLLMLIIHLLRRMGLIINSRKSATAFAVKYVAQHKEFDFFPNIHMQNTSTMMFRTVPAYINVGSNTFEPTKLSVMFKSK